MKRLIIFAAMLLTMNVLNAETVREDPPPVKPEAEQVILILKDVHDIDRSIPYCGFTRKSYWRFLTHRESIP